MAADLILWVGNDVPFASMLFNPKAKVIQIDIESTKLGKRRHNDVAILADAKEALKAIYKASETREQHRSTRLASKTRRTGSSGKTASKILMNCQFAQSQSSTS